MDRFVDASVFPRLFRFGCEHGVSAEVRGEAFNIFNRTRFGAGSTNVSDTANFGRVTNVINDARRIQLGAKISF